MYNLLKNIPQVIHQRKFVDAMWAELQGHSSKACEEFTRERIFWLMDDKSQIFK